MATTESDKLLASPFLFRFAVPCLYVDGPLWGKGGVQLDEAYRLPSFAELDGVESWADLRVGWSEQGIAINLRVEGKRQPPWCRATRMEDSDALALWFDTRDTKTVHRASKFCHAFRFMPAGGGGNYSEPVARHLKIERAREEISLVDPDLFKIRSEKRVDGFLLEAFIPAAALTGFDPAEHPKLGFNYAVIDRELGEQTFAISSEFPYQSDPSLWGTLELIKQ